jgi:catechol 2,3-dioxygenase-like lactoylglutathione lyase family enzyme
MNLRHVGMVCSSEANADRFFGKALGLKRAEPKPLASALSSALFGIDRELTVINYTDETVHIEVFIDAQGPRHVARIDHVSLDVPDLSLFLNRCRDAGATVIQVPKGAGLLTFVRDADGNLFEIKEVKNG